jgi:hypothetical protein
VGDPPCKNIIIKQTNKKNYSLAGSVPYPCVFGPPRSGSVIICTDPDPDPSIHKKKIIKTLISILLGLLVIFED